jgi:hypothetical protein
VEPPPNLLYHIVGELLPVQVALVLQFLREALAEVGVDGGWFVRSEKALTLNVKSLGVRSIQRAAFRSDGGK